MVDFDIDKNGIEHLMRSDEVHDGVRHYAVRLLEIGREECPKDTHALVNTGRLEEASDGSIDVIFGNAEVDYGMYVHTGHRTSSGSFVPGNEWMTRAKNRLVSEEPPDA